MGYLRLYIVESTITKLAELEKTLLQETHSENYTVTIKAKIGIGGSKRQRYHNLDKPNGGHNKGGETARLENVSIIKSKPKCVSFQRQRHKGGSNNSK